MNEEHAAEIALLGALLIDPQLMEQDEPLIRDIGILSVTGQMLYRAIETCHMKHDTVDIVLVMDEVENGDRIRVQELATKAMSDCPLSKNARRYADILERRAMKSSAINAAISLKEAIEGDDGPARVREHIEVLTELAGGDREEKKLDPFNLTDIMNQEPEPVPYVIKGWLAVRDFAVIGGEPGTGKSVFALDLAIALASGSMFLEHFQVDRQYRVIYLDEEMAPLLAKRRIRQLILGRQLEPEHVNLQYFNGKHLKLDTAEGRMSLRRICDRFNPDWITMDSLIRFHTARENDNTEMARVYENIKLLQEEFESGVVALHHLAKPSKDKSQELGHRLRGASDLRAAVDQLWGITGETSTDVRSLEHDKNRWGRSAVPMTMVWNESEDESVATLSGDTRSRDSEEIVTNLLLESREAGCSRPTIIKVLQADYTEASAAKIATSTLGKLKAQGIARAAKMRRRMHYWHKDYAPQRAFDDAEGD